MSEQQPTGVTPPGWYPVGDGSTRWWDGNGWTAAVASGGALVPQNHHPGWVTQDDKNLAMLAHGGALFAGFLVPLVIYLVKKDQSPFVKRHAEEALNFALTMLIATISIMVVGFITLFFLVGFFVLLIGFPLVILLQVVFAIQGAIRANRGEEYRYPISIRMIT